MSELAEYNRISNKVIETIGEHMKLLVEHMEIFNKPDSDKRLAEIECKMQELERHKQRLVGGKER
ncbi:hypothetical protein EAL2_c10870 [Peptoclostridium acidaminophilum DSM 3953]|uniref:Uncharacterized protein n=1 Tax=Peptoclostridium acidaminophilum DSM 3953 TaxID=1286171 RepID=W8T673_PEPAC|nr:hypothetical protein [Peptoclostridium acidaminophilum]AHM56385.1 hypothetical protein EAL2_c10870 [Peptoclostridium acidaminophilum DSM 3953]